MPKKRKNSKNLPKVKVVNGKIVLHMEEINREEKENAKKGAFYKMLKGCSDHFSTNEKKYSRKKRREGKKQENY